jgi:hypothetical protein
MARRNQDRTGPRKTGSDEIPPDLKQQMTNPMDFVTPTDVIDLPSKGNGYPEGHPLCGEETIEIRYMTAKDEDVLTSRSLLKKGMAIDRLISNLIKDKRIDAKSLLVGDRNAIIINARASAYGYKYKTQVTCPKCGGSQNHVFDLSEPRVYGGDDWGDFQIETTDDGTYKVELPFSKVIAEVRLLVGHDEMLVFKSMQKSKKSETDSLITNQMRCFIVSVNDYKEKKVIEYFIQNMIAQEARFLRNVLKAITPDLKIANDFECASCSHEQELEVPFGADFFWPDR